MKKGAGRLAGSFATAGYFPKSFAYKRSWI